ncbi:MAG: sigma-54-dependent Fis family transcriptional regulator [bacterium TMED46]|nr:MAG: sigma-54-dependent Fis family transcriptional regulator [bacterium TMED46]
MINVLYVGGKETNISQLSDMNAQLDYVQNGMIALSAVQTGEFDAVIIEDRLPLMTPSRLIKELVAVDSNTPVISVVRGPERKKDLLNDYDLGLFSYFEPDNSSGEEIFSILSSAKQFKSFKKDVPRTTLRHFSGVGFEKIVGVSPRMLKIYHLMCQIKSKDVTTVLYGESGTGKNLIARTLHNISLRRERPNIAVNCPAIPGELLESELFGHEKGAFTGAVERKNGKFLAANSGTIFLDEIGDMSPSLQAKILRVLESGEIERVGGAETIRVDVRIISATNQNLEQRISDGAFRQDLFHRINVFPITVPPIKSRKEDILPTAMSILKSLKKKHKLSVEYFSHDALRTLMAYDWPGNVRELENTIERVVLIHDKPIIVGDDIKYIIDENNSSLQSTVSESEHSPAAASAINVNEPESDIKNIPTERSDIDTSIVRTLKELEHEAIVAGLERTDWNMTTTAQQLGISRMTLYRKLDQHGLRKKD